MLTDIDMVVIVEKGIRGEIFHGKADNKYMKEYHKNKKRSYLEYWDENSFYDWAMSQKFQWIILSGSKILLSLMKIS